MINQNRSRTAESAAAGRAAHFLYETPIVFEDPYALALTSPMWRRICNSRLLSWLIFTKLSQIIRPIGAQILARSRYAEDRLDHAVERGVSQYVILGAGLDSFALRRMDLSQCLRVFELDHPASQQSKQKRLLSLDCTLPDNVEYVSIDCERETVAEALTRSSYNPAQRTFFSWLGTTYYLTQNAIMKTLQSITVCASINSELVFDYGIPSRLQNPEDRKAWQTINRAGSRWGEPIITSFEPAQLEDMVHCMGYEILENLSPAEQHKQYFSQHTTPPLASYFAHVRLEG